MSDGLPTSWALAVERVARAGTLEPGTVLRLPPTAVVVGRDPSCDLVLPSPDVSRQHARIAPHPDHLAVVAVGDRNVYVNKERSRIAVARDGDHVQLGGVLLRVIRVRGATLPSVGPMTLREAPPAVLLTVDARANEASLGTHRLDLQPLPLALLEQLAREPGAWHAQQALGERLWPDSSTWRPAYVNKNATYLRRALAAVVDHDPALAEQVRAAVAQVDADADADLSLAVVQGRRGAGLRLALPAGRVRVAS